MIFRKTLTSLTLAIGLSIAAPLCAQQSVPANAKKPVDQVRVMTLLGGGAASLSVSLLVKQRGIDFEPQDDYLQEVRLAGGSDELITALKSAKVTKPGTVDPADQARQAEACRHVAGGMEFSKKGQAAEAEKEFRAALKLYPQNADLYTGLANVLGQEKKWDDAESAIQEALRLDPNNDTAHYNRGVRLHDKGDVDGAIAEYREALRLNPNNEMAHHNLGDALGEKGRPGRGDRAISRSAAREPQFWRDPLEPRHRARTQGRLGWSDRGIP